MVLHERNVGSHSPNHVFRIIEARKAWTVYVLARVPDVGDSAIIPMFQEISSELRPMTKYGHCTGMDAD